MHGWNRKRPSIVTLAPSSSWALSFSSPQPFIQLLVRAKKGDDPLQAGDLSADPAAQSICSFEQHIGIQGVGDMPIGPGTLPLVRARAKRLPPCPCPPSG